MKRGALYVKTWDFWGYSITKEMTGYEIMEIFRGSLNYFWDAKTSQIYRELQRLEHKGMCKQNSCSAKMESQIKRLFHHSNRAGKNYCDGLQMATWG